MSTVDGDESTDSSRAHAVKMYLTKPNLILATILALAILHILVISFLAHPLLASNLIQLAAPSLAITLCVKRAKSSVDTYFRRLWYKLSLAFVIWAIAQAVYLWHVVEAKAPPHFPSTTDFLWLLFSFPILLVAARAKDRTANDWTGVLDIAQACFSVCLLYAVVFMVPKGYSDSLVYDIQSIALLFACAIRYSTATTFTERAFFRDLTLYVICYAVITAVGVLAQDYGSPTPGVTDLAWSFPTLIFCAIAAGLPKRIFRSLQDPERRHFSTILPAHIHGIGSLGLALTSMAAGVVMMFQKPSLGLPALAISCSLFALRTAIRESQLKRAHVQLEYDSLHDHLTGLANRALLIRELEQTIAASLPKKHLLFLDLDRFKIINDSLGHTFGDRLLLHVADVLRSSMRAEDIVARLGGDEFVILMSEGHDGIAAEVVAERILHNLRAPALLDGRVIHITGSIGIVPVRPGDTTAHLLRDADAAMYSAKSTGKNRAHIFTETISRKRARELDMEADLRRALKDGSILVNYQPIYALPTRTIEGFEALTKWTHPHYGEVSPNEFISLAEDTGLIIELGKQVLRKACYQLAAWNKHFQTKFTVSVNVFEQQLLDQTFLSYAKSVLYDTELKPSLLILEAKEQVTAREREFVTEVLRSARSLGIKVCLDSFGTGCSSLNTLLEFPFDILKLDGVLLQEIDSSISRREMLGTISHLAKNLRKKLVAEGIESQQQLDFLTALQCDSVQGSSIAAPQAPEAIAELLATKTEETSHPSHRTENPSLQFSLNSQLDSSKVTISRLN